MLLLAFPAAYALAIAPVRKWSDVLFFFISTKMLPIVGAIIPLYIIARDLHILDTQRLLVMLYTAMNLPIAVWMLRSFLLEVPKEVVEASRVDGAGVLRQMRSVILPITSPGLAATCADLLHLRLERVLPRRQPDHAQGRDGADLPGRVRPARGPVPRPPVGGRDRRLPARCSSPAGSRRTSSCAACRWAR